MPFWWRCEPKAVVMWGLLGQSMTRRGAGVAQDELDGLGGAIKADPDDTTKVMLYGQA